MRALIRRLADEGMTVMLSSHLLGEVEELCDRVAILRKGRVVFEGALAELKRTAGAAYALHTTDDDRALGICSAQDGISGPRLMADGVRFSAEEDVVARLSLALAREDVGILALVPEAATLEQLFFSLTEGDGVEGAQAPEPAGVGA